MASILQELQVKYQGREVDKTTSEIKTKITYQGSYDLCKQAMDGELKIGMTDTDLGTLDNQRLYQDEGVFWNLECIYTIEIKDGSTHHSAGTGYGPEQSTLSVSMTSIPLESAPKYRMKWNNNLYATTKGAAVPLLVWNNGTYEDDLIVGTNYEYTGNEKDLATHTYYAWGQTLSDLPSLGVDEDTGARRWFLIKKMTKPGVTNYSYPVYVITEEASHGKREQAAWAVRHKAGTIATPINGDFGVNAANGGDWLCEGGDVSFDGRYWVAKCTYTHSGGSKGWDKDLYED